MSAHYLTSRDRFTEDELLEDLRACARELGKTPGHTAFDQWAGFSGAQLYVMRFGSWREACEQAGLKPNKRPSSPKFGARRYTDEDIRRAYERIRAAVDRPPTLDDWNEHCIRGQEPIGETVRRYYDNRWMPFVEKMEATRSQRIGYTPCGQANPAGKGMCRKPQGHGPDHAYV